MRLFMLPIVVVGALTLVGCQSTQSTAGRPASGSSNDVAAGALSEKDANVATMWIRGMACPQCSYNVDLQLKRVSGVEGVKVDMLTGKVQARLSPSAPPTREQLTKAIENTTFTLVRLDMPGEQ